MLEPIVVFLVVVGVAVLAGRSFYRTFTGQCDGCGCSRACSVCPLSASMIEVDEEKGAAMREGANRICPVERAGSLNTRLRRWVQNPRRILGAFLEKGMTVLDIGCGPGFFSLDMAEMVGETGRIIACDVQEEMLVKVREKIRGAELENRISLRRCGHDCLGISEAVDFILAFYVVHEVTDQGAFFREIQSILKPDGRVLVVEPPWRVPKTAFEETVKHARIAGLTPVQRPRVFLGKAVVLEKVVIH